MNLAHSLPPVSAHDAALIRAVERVNTPAMRALRDRLSAEYERATDGMRSRAAVEQHWREQVREYL